MKKIILSTGVMAVGIASLHAAYAPGLSTMETSKPWSVSLAVRGFYDDNPYTAPSGLTEPSFGVEVTPTFSLNLPFEQTFIGLNYAYSMRYFENRPDNNVDQSHIIGAKLEHAFSERYKIQLADTFIIAQEPTVLDPNGIITTPIRTEGNNLHNIASVTFNAQITELIGLELGYANNYYDYEQDAGDVTSPTNPFGVGSRSALLDRMEQLISLSLRYQIQPTLIGILGYQYGMADYNSDELIFGPPTPVTSEVRNTRSQYFFVGVDNTFNDRMSGSLRVGGRYTDYYNNANADNNVTPYVDGSLSYTYNPGSFIQAGIRVDKNATDVVGTNAADPTVDQQSGALYAALTHRITGKLSGNLLGQYQLSKFEGGSVDGSRDNFYIVGAG
ncbi:MAG: outer membrane beta-barrel protein, partial [Opitutaceae bacterium]|nr:outer membrane beta-barrel protein [Verrucomicrobiales bacterium]